MQPTNRRNRREAAVCVDVGVLGIKSQAPNPIATNATAMPAIHGVRDGRAIIINAKVTHDQIAAMVGSTRQWVTMMMKRFQKEGVLTVTPRHIRIERPAALLDMVSKRGT